MTIQVSVYKSYGGGTIRYRSDRCLNSLWMQEFWSTSTVGWVCWQDFGYWQDFR